MKIGLLTEKYTPDIGGLAISAGRLARLLSSGGHEVHVVAPTLNLPASGKQTLGSNGISVTRFGAHKRVDDTLVDWFDQIVGEHRRKPFDVLHAYFLTQAGYVATYAAKYLEIPSVVSMRGNDVERAPFDPARFGHVMYALQNANVLTTNANELAKKAEALFEREVIVIPNGVDTAHFRPLERNLALTKTLGINHNSGSLDHFPIMGFVGELRAKKGLRVLLDAYADVNGRNPTALLIVGEVRPGEDRNAFDECVAATPGATVIVTGQVSPDNLPAYYSLIDVHIHPSLRDGMPNAVLEAMACGKPVVATAVGGIPDVIKDGRNGVLVAVNDAHMLAAKVSELLGDSQRRAQLGTMARQSVVWGFSEQQELEGNLSVYRNLGITS